MNDTANIWLGSDHKIVFIHKNTSVLLAQIIKLGLHKGKTPIFRLSDLEPEPTMTF